MPESNISMYLPALKYGLAAVTAVVFTAIFMMSFFHEGTSIGKYVSKQNELERVKEVETIAYSDMVLFGDESEQLTKDADLTATSGTNTGFIFSESLINIDKWLILGLMAVSWIMLIPQLQQQRGLSFIYLLMGIYLFSLSFCKMLNGGTAYSQWAIPAHATRWVPCLALWLWLYMKPKIGENSLLIIRWMLVISVSLTFMIHGLEALLLHAGFRDLLIGGFASISVNLSFAACDNLLRLIGIMDISLAALVLFTQRKFLFMWMAIWGALTALSRPISSGGLLWEDALLRTGNFMVPLILFLWFYYQPNYLSKKTTQNEIML